MCCEILVSTFSGLLGACVGAIATHITMVKQFKIIAEQEREKQKREDKIHLKGKREETYLRMLDILYLLRNESLVPNNRSISEKRKKEIDECFAPINVYASQSIKNMYIKAAKQIDLYFMKNQKDTTPLKNALDLIDEFIELIRKELGIED